MLEVYSYNNSTQCFQLACAYDQDLYTKMNLSLQDLFMTVLEDGLNEQNALTTLMIAHETNALKIISLTRGFIMTRRKCVNIKSNWGHLLSTHPKIFLTVAKIMMGMNIEYDANAFTTFFEVKKGIRISNYCSYSAFYSEATKN